MLSLLCRKQVMGQTRRDRRRQGIPAGGSRFRWPLRPAWRPWSTGTAAATAAGGIADDGGAAGAVGDCSSTRRGGGGRVDEGWWGEAGLRRFVLVVSPVLGRGSETH